MSVTQIVPRLFQGSVPPAEPLDVDLVVLCAEEHQFPSRVYGSRPFGSARVLRCPLTDWNEPLSSTRVRLALDTAVQVARVYAHGSKVLVTCAMGLNRSGLITALTLIELGCEARAAIAAVRRARPQALGNKHFEHLILSIGSRRRAVA